MPQTPNVPPLDPHPPVPYQQSVPAPPPPSSLEQTQQNPRYRPENMLLVLSDGRQMPVRETQMVVGRHPESDIVVNDPEVSARHMIFSAQPEGIVVWDDNSTNGTFVNGERLVGSRRLGVGDTVRIGDITMQLREAPPPA
ncbi:MAG: FHA domain-containing protein, partial [Anaerolineales bacterium]